MTKQQTDQLEFTKLRIMTSASIANIRKLTDQYIADNIQENLRYAREVGKL